MMQVLSIIAVSSFLLCACSAFQLFQDSFIKNGVAVPASSTRPNLFSQSKILMSTLEPSEPEAADVTKEGEEITVNLNLKGKAMLLEFGLQEYTDGVCKAQFNRDGTVWFTDGWKSREPGRWRIEDAEEDEEPGLYLQFTCPVTDVYQRLFDSGEELYYRAKLNVPAEAASTLNAISLENGLIITEKLKWFGLGTEFVQMGSFGGKILGRNEKVPAPKITVEEFYLKALQNRKNKSRQ